LVRAVGEGSATVTATREGVSGTAAITVGPVPLASVTVMPSSRTFARIGDTSQLAVTLRDASGHVLIPRPITWRSDNAGVAMVDPTGLVQAVGLGSTTVTATCEGVSDTAAITVVDGISLELAFMSTRDGNDEIYGMNANGSVQIDLSENLRRDFNPVWSPDGTRIAFQSGSISVMNVEDYTRWSLHVRSLCCIFNMDWSPDGRRIAFITTDDYYGDPPLHVGVVDVAGGSVRNLTPNSLFTNDPVWSPDGQKIAFGSYQNRNWEIYVMNKDGSSQTNLTNNASRDAEPQWSTDGGQIAWVSNRDGNYEIYVMNADGSAPINLTQDPAEDGDLQWSPDGQRIAFASSRDGNREIYVMNKDGSSQTNLTNNPAGDTDPQWSPDGQKIAFLSYRDGNAEIYVMNADGSGQTNLTNDPGNDTTPRWRP
jgi:Tol biopolymer transport system component